MTDRAANQNIDISAEIAAAKLELAAAGQPTDWETVARLFAWRWVMASRGVTKGFLRYPPDLVRIGKPVKEPL